MPYASTDLSQAQPGVKVEQVPMESQSIFPQESLSVGFAILSISSPGRTSFSSIIQGQWDYSYQQTQFPFAVRATEVQPFLSPIQYDIFSQLPYYIVSKFLGKATPSTCQKGKNVCSSNHTIGVLLLTSPHYFSSLLLLVFLIYLLSTVSQSHTDFE